MKNNLTGDERALFVRSMFTTIAPRYDLMNRLMTGGMDLNWRKQVIALAELRPGAHLLDLGAGTGDLAREALRQSPDVKVLAADFTLAMMLTGRDRYASPRNWAGADAMRLPFPDQSFDSVVSGFLLRNVVGLDLALQEQFRILRPGGHFVTLDTTRPRRNLLSPLIHFYMRHVIPVLGNLLARSRDAYTYLPETSENFLPANELAARIHQAGFSQVGFKRLNFGTVAIHWAVK